jgi:transcriptional antiterminator RfaH
MTTINARWYLVRTKQYKEDLVRTLLLRKIPESFLPFLVIRWDARGNRCLRKVPLFPCYVFALFDLKTQYHSVQRTPGVNGIVCVGGGPSEIDESIIDEIRSRGRDGMVELPPKGLQAGESVIVRSGPFRGLSAVFERYLSGPERVAVLINFISGRTTRLIMPAGLVQPVNIGYGS